MATTDPVGDLTAFPILPPAGAVPTHGSPEFALGPAAPPQEPAAALPRAADAIAEQGRGGEGRAGAPGGLPPRPANTRYQSLDLWRGAACVMLLLYHATFYGDYQFRLSDRSTWTWAGVPLHVIRHCWFGVPIFFVISGYCIAGSIDSLRRKPHSLRDYFVRRFRRIYPPLWIMCGLAVLFTWAMAQLPAVREHCHQLPDLAGMSAWQWLGNFVAAESWRHQLGGGEPAYLMANTWTLCYEEQFYFVTGLLLAFSGRRFFQMAAWLTLAVLVLRHAGPAMGIPREGFFWDGHWLMFAAGLLIYHALNYASWRKTLITHACLAAGMGYAVAARWSASNFADKHLAEYLFVASAFGILLIGLRRWDRPISQHAWLAPLRWCGQRSYSIYLTHYLVVVVVSSWLALGGLRSEWHVATVVVPACTLVSLPVAVLFYELVERRFLNQPA
ncbi:MAG: acyltransferase family protein [Pirellulaceae bacterium]